MKPAQELVDEWYDATPEDEISETDLVRVARVELLEELIEETQYGNVGSADYLRSRLREARTK